MDCYNRECYNNNKDWHSCSYSGGASGPDSDKCKSTHISEQMVTRIENNRHYGSYTTVDLSPCD